MLNPLSHLYDCCIDTQAAAMMHSVRDVTGGMGHVISTQGNYFFGPVVRRISTSEVRCAGFGVSSEVLVRGILAVMCCLLVSF